MRRSKRKFEAKTGHFTRQTKLVVPDIVSDCRLDLPGKWFEDVELPENLLHHCLRQILPHIWYKILPSSSSDVETMSFACGQSWDIVLPLLLQLKYVFKYKDTIRLRYDKWTALQLLDDVLLDVHIGSAEPHNGLRTYYICTKKPYYDNPSWQIKGEYTYSHLRYTDRFDKMLTKKIKEVIKKSIDLNQISGLNVGASKSEGSFPATQPYDMITLTSEIAAEAPMTSMIEREIDQAISLDLSLFPRYHHVTTDKVISLSSKKRADTKEKLLIFVTAARWGYYSKEKPYNQRIRLLLAAARLIAYANGYKTVFSTSTILRWELNIHSQVTSGVESSLVVKQCGGGSVRDSDKIELAHPGYLHYLFRVVVKRIGYNAGFQEIAHHMNLSSCVPSETRMSISLSRRQVNVWFNDNKGKQISPIEKPLDTPQHCALRIDWVLNNYGRLTNPYLPICYIDEKWFYRVSRRRKLKLLPKGEHENDNVDKAQKSTMLSRRFPIKTMFMAVVARPIPHRNFDGKVHIERVSKTRILSTATSHSNFTDDALNNDALKKGMWREICSEMDVNADDIIELLSVTYNLDEYIQDRMEVFYVTKIGSNGNTKKVVLDRCDYFKTCKVRDNDDKNVPERSVLLSDLEVQVRNFVGDTVEDDCSCDSEYMMGAMKRVGEAIRKRFDWIPMSQKCYLVMDNAGGHGTKDAIADYRNDLLTSYNVEIIFQIPRSPFTNVLDLGVWMSLQAVVERKHFLRRSTTAALENTVMQTWNSTDLNQVLTNVFGRLRVVLCNILKGKGGNTLVEEDRGLSGKNIKIESTIRVLEKNIDKETVDFNNFEKENSYDNHVNEIEFEEV